MDVKIEAGWKSRLNGEFEKDYFIRLAGFVRDEYSNNDNLSSGSSHIQCL